MEIARIFLLFLRGFAPSREVSYFPLCFDDGEEVGDVGGEVGGRKMSHAKDRDDDGVHLD